MVPARFSVPPRPLPFVLAATEHGTLIVNYRDQRMLSPTNGFGVGYQLLGAAIFEPTEVQLALTLLNWRRELHGEGVVALDCGANIGVQTIEWARQMTGWGQVRAFEAQERLFYALAGNIALNNCMNARADNVALSDVDGFMDIPVPDYTKFGSFGSLELQVDRPKREDIGQVVDLRPESLSRVRSVRLDSLDLPRVDFLKIDVEGMEPQVLAGAAGLVARFRPYLVIEHIKTGTDALSAILSRLDYRWWGVGVNLIALPAEDPAVSRIVTTPAKEPEVAVAPAA